MKRSVALILAIALLGGSAALADSWSGSVIARETVLLSAPAEGVLERLDLLEGQEAVQGETVGSIQVERVFAPLDGTVAAIHAAEGDTLDGTVVEIAPTSLYSVTSTITGYAKTAENALIHLGETLYMKCTTDGSHRAVGTVTKVDGSNFTVETIGGALYIGETVNLYRDPNFDPATQVGRGTVLAHATETIKGTGVLKALRVKVGDPVERGQWLFSTASAEKTEAIVPASGIVTAVKGTVGAEVKEEDTLAEIAVSEALRISVSTEDAGLFHAGDEWSYIRGDDPHEERLPCTVIRVLVDEKNSSATVDLKPETENLPLGLTVYVTNEKE